jgi:hypothetical protein
MNVESVAGALRSIRKQVSSSQAFADAEKARIAATADADNFRRTDIIVFGDCFP